ncbi:MAG: cytochrome c [Oligoflexia bacterium]|nr:cytochrome c [Oligoflexia bacterium]
MIARYALILVILALPFTAAADLEKGKAIFMERCITCHGTEGKGDGPIAAGLPADMKPRDLQTGTMKVAVDDAKFKELILKGGTAFGLNALMPPQAGLSDADIASLIEFVHSLRKK